MTNNIVGLGHVAIKIADVERSLGFYVGKLGLQEFLRLNKDDGTLWLVYLRVTDEQFIEIFPAAVRTGTRARTGPGSTTFA